MVDNSPILKVTEVPFGPSIFVTQNNLIAQQIISSIIQENENPSDSNSPTNPTEEAPEETNANSKRTLCAQ